MNYFQHGFWALPFLPFGLISAQDEFQRKIDETYEGLNGVMAIVDDILIYGQTKAEHDENLHVMLQRSRERGVKLNPGKSVICATEVSYFGHLLTAEGVKPDPAKITKETWNRLKTKENSRQC